MNKIDWANEFYFAEMIDHNIYKYFAANTKDPKLQKVLSDISKIEMKHAWFWKKFIEDNNGELKKNEGWYHISSFKILSKILPSMILLSLRELWEKWAVLKYYKFLKEETLTKQEQEKIKSIIIDEIDHENAFGSMLKWLNTWNIRDFVLGTNDGLVEILWTVAWLSAIYIANTMLVGISWLIVWVAWALSMGIWAYISVKSQRQVKDSISEEMKIICDIDPIKWTERYKENLIEAWIDEKTAQEISAKLLTQIWFWKINMA